MAISWPKAKAASATTRCVGGAEGASPLTVYELTLDNGTVRCWGNGVSGRLGYGNQSSVGDDETPGAAGPVDIGAGRTAVALAELKRLFDEDLDADTLRRLLEELPKPVLAYCRSGLRSTTMWALSQADRQPLAVLVADLDQVDGELDSTLELRGRVARVIRELRPQVVLGHDPWKRYRLHPDHRHAGLLACDGIVAARDPHFFPEQALPHHRPDALLLFEADEPNHVEGVSGWVDIKLHALEAHASQLHRDAGRCPFAAGGRVAATGANKIGRAHV